MDAGFKAWVLAALAVGLSAVPSAYAQSDLLADWNAAFLNAVRAEVAAPTLASRNLAIFHTAIYDAVNSIERTHQPYFGFLPTSPKASPEAATIGAAYQVSISLFPSERAMFDQLRATTLASLPAGSARAEGLSLGLSAANAISAARAGDGAGLSVPYIPSSEPGAWRRTPPFYRPPEAPQSPYVKPFAMTSGNQFRPPGPPALNSERYAADLNEVRSLGAADSTMRTPEQTQIARFWSDFSYTATPAGHWNEITLGVAESHELSLAEEARLMALLNIALADAGIVAWDAKYAFNLWRPITAIQQADRDGNPATEADLNWQPLLTTPPFPEYVSGHSTFSAAAGAVLAEFFGTDELHLVARSDTLTGVTREFDSVHAAVEEVGRSRIYGGIHFPSADYDGRAAGGALGQYVADNFLKPIPESTTLALLGLGLAGLALGRRRDRTDV